VTGAAYEEAASAEAAAVALRVVPAAQVRRDPNG